MYQSGLSIKRWQESVKSSLFCYTTAQQPTCDLIDLFQECKDMDSSRFNNPPQPPSQFAATATAIDESSKRIHARHKAVLDRIVAEVKPEEATFDNVLRPMLLEEDASAGNLWEDFFYSTVSPHKDLRDASRVAIERSNDYDIECNMREDVFKLVEGVYNSRDCRKLDGECLRILEKARDKYVQNGLLLPPGSQRERFKEVQKRISRLCNQCQELLDENTGGVWFQPDDLQSVPKDELDIDTLEKGADENAGKVKVTFKEDHRRALMRYAARESTRRVYSIANANMVSFSLHFIMLFTPGLTVITQSPQANENAPLFQEVIELRDEAARLLGYPNHATLAISNKMAKTPERVNDFLQDLDNRTKEAAKADVACLLEYKKRDCESRNTRFDGNLYMWDVEFYSRMRKDVDFAIDESLISQYFAVGPTIKGMLDIFADIFGFVFVKLTEDDCARISPTGRPQDVTWHIDTEIYSVWNGDDEENGGGEFCGYLYLDLYPRGSKYGHNANYTIYPGCIKHDGTRSYPSTALVCNFSRPTSTRPALLKHGEVVTLFHELGHGMHTLACNTRYERSVEFAQDFIEAPSQMLENWCWTPRVLHSLSRHWESGDKIPSEVVEKLVAAKNLHVALRRRVDILTSLFDMAVHTDEAVGEIDCAELWNRLRRDICETKGPEDMGMGL